MFGFNINGDKDLVDVLSEMFSAKRRKQGEIKRNLEIARQKSEIQHINAQTRADSAKAQHEIASVNLENANAELVRAQTMKTREEVLKLRLENINFAFELAEKANNFFTPEQKLNMIIKVLLED